MNGQTNHRPSARHAADLVSRLEVALRRAVVSVDESTLAQRLLVAYVIVAWIVIVVLWLKDGH